MNTFLLMKIFNLKSSTSLSVSNLYIFEVNILILFLYFYFFYVYFLLLIFTKKGRKKHTSAAIQPYLSKCTQRKYTSKKPK